MSLLIDFVADYITIGLISALLEKFTQKYGYTRYCMASAKKDKVTLLDSIKTTFGWLYYFMRDFKEAVQMWQTGRQ